MHHLFIVNPVAGKGKALHITSEIESRFNGFDHTYEISVTKAPGHAEEIAKEATLRHDKVRLYAVGGDGTLNEVVNGIAGSETELGIIPCGSGNDAARSLYPVMDPAKLIKVLPMSYSVPVDLGRLNDRFFINIASIGFDADVVLNRNYFKGFPFISGPASYILGVLATLIKCKKYKLYITLDDKEPMEKELLLSIFANGSYYGGGMKAAPSAKTDDGILDFYLVDSCNRRKILRFFPLFRKGQHETMKEVTHTQGKRAVIESTSLFPVNIDGEVNMETRVSVEILHKNINIIIP
ncbi:MAG: diacylglycerol kinase family lipid kinase [Clostridiaceae bacterium]|nr:diacylglycerol kinase family lipid kinase [Clostridiaceae bacterium]